MIDSSEVVRGSIDKVVVLPMSTSLMPMLAYVASIKTALGQSKTMKGIDHWSFSVDMLIQCNHHAKSLIIFQQFYFYLKYKHEQNL